MNSNLQNILITGGAGFIGSNFVSYFLEANPAAQIINLDKLSYAGSLKNLTTAESNPRHTFVHGDICDDVLVNNLFEEFDFTGVIHFAAESHVDNSIENPSHFIKSNINGTFSLLEAARRWWLKEPGESKMGFETARFHHISTDEVYGSLGEEGFFDENTSYAPNSPYSASKAASDFLVRSYHHTYGMNTVISNCSNNYGPNQHNEKLIPTIIRKAINDEAIPIYGDGSNVRDWLYVLDHCAALQLIFENGISGETYVVGGNNELSNLEIAKRICSHLDQRLPRTKGSYLDLITFVDDRPGHDYRYAIDASKVKSELGWEAKESFSTGLEKTIEHYLGPLNQNV